MTREYRWKWAIFSEDGAFRYHLTRNWNTEALSSSYEAIVHLRGHGKSEGARHIVPTVERSLGWVLCNPSTADGMRDDATISKLTKYSQMWGYDGMWVCNLWARKATDWGRLIRYSKKQQDIIGPENDLAVGGMMAHCPEVVWAWGNVATKVPGYRARVNRVKALAKAVPGLELKYLVRTKSGAPGHPLYLPDNIRPKPIRIGG